jgi:hypothetical protein
MALLKLSDQQLSEVQDLIRLVPPSRRHRFIETLADYLAGVDLRPPGTVHRVGALALRDFAARTRIAAPPPDHWEDCA